MEAVSPAAIELIFSRFGTPSIDLFASRLNAKCSGYFSWRADPGSLACDAFAQSWKGLVAYAFPPFNLVGRTIRKAIHDGSESIIIVAPRWHSQAFFPLLSNVPKERVLSLGHLGPGLLTNPLGEEHPYQTKIAAWQIFPRYCVTGEVR